MCEHMCLELEAMIVPPVVLVVIVTPEAHFNKTVMQPKKGVYIKGVDLKLPGRLEASADYSPETDPHSVATMMHDWNDRRHETLSCSPKSEEAKKFKASKKGN